VPNQYEDLVQQAMRDFSDALDRADDASADRVSPVPRTTAGPDEDVDEAAPPPPGQPAPAPTPGKRARSEPYGSLAGLGSGQRADLIDLVGQTVSNALALSAAAASRDQRRYFVFGLLASLPIGVITGVLTNLMPRLG
jgi:hypothetical protein